MDSKVFQFRIGVMVLVSFLLLVALALLFGDVSSLWRPGYEIQVRLNDATGVQRGTPVRKSGLLIGRVTGVKLEDHTVLVTLWIDKSVTLHHDETCLLRNSIFGDAELAFIPAETRDRPREQ